MDRVGERTTDFICSCGVDNIPMDLERVFLLILPSEGKQSREWPLGCLNIGNVKGYNIIFDLLIALHSSFNYFGHSLHWSLYNFPHFLRLCNFFISLFLNGQCLIRKYFQVVSNELNIAIS